MVPRAMLFCEAQVERQIWLDGILTEASDRGKRMGEAHMPLVRRVGFHGLWPSGEARSGWIVTTIADPSLNTGTSPDHETSILKFLRMHLCSTVYSAICRFVLEFHHHVGRLVDLSLRPNLEMGRSHVAQLLKGPEANGVSTDTYRDDEVSNTCIHISCLANTV